jgi:hypothetical protein
MASYLGNGLPPIVGFTCGSGREIIVLAESKSPTTISSYLRGVRLYLAWCEQNGHPLELTRAQV